MKIPETNRCAVSLGRACDFRPFHKNRMSGKPASRLVSRNIRPLLPFSLFLFAFSRVNRDRKRKLDTAHVFFSRLPTSTRTVATGTGKTTVYPPRSWVNTNNECVSRMTTFQHTAVYFLQKHTARKRKNKNASCGSRYFREAPPVNTQQHRRYHVHTYAKHKHSSQTRGQLNATASASPRSVTRACGSHFRRGKYSRKNARNQ